MASDATLAPLPRAAEDGVGGRSERRGWVGTLSMEYSAGVSAKTPQRCGDVGLSSRPLALSGSWPVDSTRKLVACRFGRVL